jgi:uncharacterized protein YjbI with pentapeptide repeats
MPVTNRTSGVIEGDRPNLVSRTKSYSESAMERRDFTDAELKKIIDDHAVWLATEGREGTRADLSQGKIEGRSIAGANLARALLVEANLEGSDLQSANLDGADLSRAVLRNASLVHASLREVRFVGARLEGANFVGADLTGADLTDTANLNHAKLGSGKGDEGPAAIMRKTVLGGVTLAGLVLDSFDFSGAYMGGVWLRNTSLRGAKLAGADLQDAHLEGADLVDADLSGVDLSGAHLQGSFLWDASLVGANLTDADLSGADLSGIKSINITYRRAVWMRERLASGSIAGGAPSRLAETRRDDRDRWILNVRADLADADLTRTNLANADLRGVSLKGATLRRANLADADLRGVIGLRLDGNFVRGARFSPVTSSMWSWLSRGARRKQASLLITRHPEETVPSFHRTPIDPWSVLRQLYAGPRLTFLVISLIAFALPYAGRAALWAAIGSVERKVNSVVPGVVDAALQTTRLGAEATIRDVTAEARSLTDEIESRGEKEVSKALREKIRDSEARVKERLELGLQRGKEAIGAAAIAIERRVDSRPVWKVLLRWGESTPWPAILALALIAYNVGIYILVTNVASLRDEEERSGFSPALADYLDLVRIHRLVNLLFFVSTASFMFNLWYMLVSEVSVLR